MTLKAYDELNALKTAEEKGEARGKEEGLQEGMEAKAIEIAKNSISLGLDNKTISLITKLDEECIKRLRRV
jgi:predicted transposase YdaD